MTTPNDRMIEWRLAAFLFGCSALCFAGHGTSVDENLIVQVVDSMVNHGTLTVDKMFQALEGPDGRYYSRYGFGFPALLAPFFWIGKALVWAVPESAAYCGNAFMFAMLWSSVMFTALVGWLLYRTGRLMGGSASTCAALGVACVLGTPFLPYGQSLYRLTASTVLLLATLECVLRHKKNPRGICLFGMGALTALGINIREDLIIGLFWLGFLAILSGPYRQRLRRGASMLIGVGVGAMLWGLHNYVRFGEFFVENYADVALDYPLIISLPPLAFGLRRGLFVYAPIALLWPVSLEWLRGERWIKNGAICTAMLVSYFILYGKSDFWHGGVCWGPRHLYFLLPFALLPMIPFLESPPKAWKWISLGALSLAGFVMNWPGVYSHTGKYEDFFSSPSFFSHLMRPVESADYVWVNDFDLWWIRMIKLEPLSLWPIAFLGCLAFTAHQGCFLYKAIQKPESEA